MASIISAIDKHTPRQLGENTSVEYGWSNDLNEKIVQFFFQLVRSKDHRDLEKQLDMILQKLKGYENSKEFMLMYKLIAQTRDILEGKGEQQLTFMQIWRWYENGYDQLSCYALLNCCIYTTDPEQHPFGSWKDVKYFANYVKMQLTKKIVTDSRNQWTRTEVEVAAIEAAKEHPLVKFICDIALKQLENDWTTYKEDTDKKLTLVSRWIPREKSKKFGWLFKALALTWARQDPEASKWLSTASISFESLRRAKIKCYIHFNKRLTTLNKVIDTAQIKFCSQEWKHLKFNCVTSQTLRKNKLAIRNLTKNKKIREHKTEEGKRDRELCAVKYQEHIDAAQRGDTTKKVHGRRCNVYELVKEAILENDDQTTNQQWLDNSKNNKGLENMISMVDTSGSMEQDDFIPLYNALGLGIRASEKTIEPFRNRVLTFDVTPQWVIFKDTQTFCEKARWLKRQAWGMNTNFFKALNMILDACIENNLPPSDVKNLVLAIFSDMQIDPQWSGYGDCNNLNSMLDHMKDLFRIGGMLTTWKTPYELPHILFWNLRKTSGFPTLSTEPNVTMLSGYSSVLLNIFAENGIEALKKFTPMLSLEELLGKPRYQPMGRKVEEIYH